MPSWRGPRSSIHLSAWKLNSQKGVSKPDFVFMFGSIGYDQRSLVRAVREATGGAPLTGCSAEGTINGNEFDESNFSVVVTAISSDELQWTNGLATGLSVPNKTP